VAGLHHGLEGDDPVTFLRELISPSLSATDVEQGISFREFYILRSIPFLQVGLVLGAGLFSAFAMWDLVVDPANYALTSKLRYFLISPALLLLAAALMLKGVRRRVELAAVVGLGIAALGLNGIYLLQEGSYTYSITGNMMIMVFLLVFLRFEMRVMVAMTGGLCGVYFLMGAHLVGVKSPEFFIHNLVLISTAGMGLLASAFTIRTARQVLQFGHELGDAKRRIEDLLYALLPERIAKQLSEGKRDIAEPLNGAWVLFADIVGFTALSNELSAPRLVALLNEVFNRFDLIMAEYGVEKIKTIGDGYMAIAHDQGEASVEAGQQVIKAARLMIDAVAEISEQDKVALSLRVGVHAGPVIAGVIGRSKFAYDCWGATVNLASRLESAGDPGSVNVSTAVRVSLGDTCEFRDRGEFEVKGFGAVQMFAVV
jgi:class 3 adenylate cyclase